MAPRVSDSASQPLQLSTFPFLCRMVPIYYSVFSTFLLTSSIGRAGYAIAFSYSWKLTLVISASVPLIALAGLVQAKFMFGLNRQVCPCQVLAK